MNEQAKQVLKSLKEVAAAKGLTNEADEFLLELTATLIARWREAEAMIESDGLIKISPNGYPQQSDGVTISANTQKQLLTCLRELGFTPKARKDLVRSLAENNITVKGSKNWNKLLKFGRDK